MAKKPIIRTAFNKAPRAARIPAGESAAQQNFKNDADINTIVSRYRKTGILGNPNATRRPQFGDYTSIDFLEMRNQIASMDQMFASLPARLRSRFQNDPYQLIRWMEDSNNKEEAEKLGLLPKRPETAPPAPAESDKAPKGDLTEEAAKAAKKTAPPVAGLPKGDQ